MPVVSAGAAALIGSVASSGLQADSQAGTRQFFRLAQVLDAVFKVGSRRRRGGGGIVMLPRSSLVRSVQEHVHEPDWHRGSSLKRHAGPKRWVVYPMGRYGVRKSGTRDIATSSDVRFNPHRLESPTPAHADRLEFA